MAVRRGVWGGSSLWLFVGALIWIMRLFRRLGRSGGGGAVVTRLRDGESIVVSAAPTSRRRSLR